jgi:hypothetical protein
MTRKARLGRLRRQQVQNSTRLCVGRGKAKVCLKSAWQGQFCGSVAVSGRFSRYPHLVDARLRQMAASTRRISAFFIRVSVRTECFSR